MLRRWKRKTRCAAATVPPGICEFALVRPATAIRIGGLRVDGKQRYRVGVNTPMPERGLSRQRNHCSLDGEVIRQPVLSKDGPMSTEPETHLAPQAQF